MADIPTRPFLTDLDGDTAVIACHFNPCGYKRPRKNLHRFLHGMAEVGAPVYMAELAYYGQPFQLPQTDRTILFRAGPEAILFQKEHLLNLVEQIVPPRFTKIVAWDADVLVQNDDWRNATSRLLDSYSVVQPYSRALWLGPNDEEIGCKLSVAYAANNNFHDPLDISLFHPGLGVAVRRSFFREVGGFEGCVITGSGDTLTMVGALQHDPANRPFFRKHSEAWGAPQLEWCHKMYRWSGGRIGAVATDIKHLYHGSHTNRRYLSRFGLVEQFDPRRDLCRNDDGITCWTWKSMQGELPAAINNYFHSRAEDD